LVSAPVPRLKIAAANLRHNRNTEYCFRILWAVDFCWKHISKAMEFA